MKSYIKNIFYLVLFAAAAISCKDDDSIRIPESGIGPNVRIAFDPNFGFINFDDLDNAKLKFNVYSESSNLEKVDVNFVYTTGGVNSDTIVFKTITQADINAAGGVIENIEISAQELVDKIPGLDDLSDLSGGDSFTMLNFTTMADGAVYPQPTIDGNTNVAPNIVNAAATTSFTVSYQAFVGCPSDPLEFNGDYASEITASNYGGFVGASNDVVITFVGPEPFRYNISDISALAYAPFGGSAYPGDIYDICGNPQMLPTSTFGVTTDTGGGTWDPVNGVLTLNLFESNNGLSWTIVFTKK